MYLLISTWLAVKLAGTRRVADRGASTIELAVITAALALLAVAVCAAVGVRVWALFEPLVGTETPTP